MTISIDRPPRPAAQGARAVFSGSQRLLLLAAFVLLVIFRIPHAWEHGRFQDEEATVFLAYAWHHPWWDALFRPFAGYLNLGATSTTLLVAQAAKHGLLPLEYAPYCSMLMALSVQCLPAVLILTGRAAWLAQRSTVIAALLTLAVAPGIEEVFFNVLHIQFHLALCAALILALDAPQRVRGRVCYALLLFLAPLCGPGALAFLPLFALRALIDRDARRWEQAAAFAAGGTVQMLVFYGHNPARGHFLNPGMILAVMFVRLIVMPLVGFGKAEAIGEAIFESQIAGGSAWLWAVAASLLAFGTLFVLAIRRRDAAIWLLLSSLTVAAATYGFGMLVLEPQAPFDLDAERYTFLPLVLLGMTLAVLAARAGSPGRLACAVLLGLMLITGVSRYTRALPGLRDGPSWPREVAGWRHDHNHPLAVWPAPWAADLSDRVRPCRAAIAPRGTAGDPRYCESGWLAGFPSPHPTPAQGR